MGLWPWTVVSDVPAVAFPADALYRLSDGLGRERFSGPEDPDSMFLAQWHSAPERAQNNLIFRAFQFQRVSRLKLQIVADGLRENDPACLVDGEGSHKWHFTMVFTIQ
jgi:hypothetical protein